MLKKIFCFCFYIERFSLKEKIFCIFGGHQVKEISFETLKYAFGHMFGRIPDFQLLLTNMNKRISEIDIDYDSSRIIWHESFKIVTHLRLDD